MYTVRDPMATTSFVGERETEKGFAGRGIVAGDIVGRDSAWVDGLAGLAVRWMCMVESQEAEIRRLCSLL